MGLVLRHTRGATLQILSNYWQMTWRKRELYGPAYRVIPLPGLGVPPQCDIYQSSCHRPPAPVCVIRAENLGVV